jgi:integrin-linked kinase
MEALIDQSYSEKSDVWAYAVTLVEIGTRDDPYPDLSKVQVAAKVSRGDLRPPVPAGVPQVIADLITQCTSEDPDERPTFRAITESLRDA